MSLILSQSSLPFGLPKSIGFCLKVDLLDHQKAWKRKSSIHCVKSTSNGPALSKSKMLLHLQTSHSEVVHAGCCRDWRPGHAAASQGSRQKTPCGCCHSRASQGRQFDSHWSCRLEMPGNGLGVRSSWNILFS